MTGPEHYKAAEKLLSDASFTTSDGSPVRRNGYGFGPGQHAALLQRALVHAQLAHAAATAQGALTGSTADGLEGMSDRDVAAWNEVAGVPVVAAKEGES